MHLGSLSLLKIILANEHGSSIIYIACSPRYSNAKPHPRAMDPCLSYSFSHALPFIALTFPAPSSSFSSSSIASPSYQISWPSPSLTKRLTLDPQRATALSPHHTAPTTPFLRPRPYR